MATLSLSLSLGHHESELLRKLEVSEFWRQVKRVSAEVPAVSGGSATSPIERAYGRHVSLSLDYSSRATVMTMSVSGRGSGGPGV